MKKKVVPFVWFRYHKPVGVLSTTLPTRQGRSILDALGPAQRDTLRELAGGLPVVTVGRLDKDSSGLLLLTSDESVTGSLLRSRSVVKEKKEEEEEDEREGDDDEGSPVEKVYEVETNKRMRDSAVATMAGGMDISLRNWRKGSILYRTLPCVVERIPERKRGLRVVLREGKTRQIRKMVGALGLAAVTLHRVRFGSVELGELGAGEMEQMTKEEVERLLSVIKKS